MPSPSPTAFLDIQVRAAARGDQEAFASLVDATRTLVCSIALAILRDVEASRDVAQDVFLSAWRDLGKLRNPASFLPWLRQMTRNRAHHVLRDRVRSRRVISDAEADDLMAAATDPRPGAGEILLADEEKRRLAEALEALSDESREVVTLYYREGRSVRQVADLLGLREEAVKQRLTRARSRLRREMLDRLGETLQRTAPGAAFTTGLMTSLALGAPASAAAAGFGTAAKLSPGGLAKLVALLGGAALGATGGILGVVLGARSVLARARDEQERRGIRLIAAGYAATVVAAAAAGMAFNPDPVSYALAFLLFCVILLALTFGWLPRVTARRLAAELTEDPGAFERRRRERRMLILAVILSFLAGGCGVLLDILLSGGK
ncbi:MAG TPA: sigma-70 family RNA polymerase sigma factor [Thermoanaerobaculia bacterium]|nr:sigma-70 family RNA polymerase sigma factor [Thermoanaerobaculia bacterium]